jgi:hypothetical protein
MKQFSPPSCLLALLFFAACAGSTTPETTAPAAANAATTGKHCYLLAEGKDTTTVGLTVNADNTVTGNMEWSPYEKDGAYGTLKGTKTATGELDLLYSYTIEGSNQTETVMMMEENGMLKIKDGELIDPKMDGNLKYKDIATAKYTKILTTVPCK